MANKMTPDELRKKAQDLIKKAEALENRVFLKLGKHILKYQKNNFGDFSIEQFKTEINEIMRAK